MRNSKKDVFICILLFLMALVIVAVLFMLKSAQPKQRVNAKYQQQMDPTSSTEETIGKYDITHYIDAQAYNKDGQLLVFISASGTKYHYAKTCTHLLNVETKNITETEALQLGRSICSSCENNFSSDE